MYGLLTASYALLIWALRFAQQGMILRNKDKKPEEIGRKMLRIGGFLSGVGIVFALSTLESSMPDELANALRYVGIGMLIAGFGMLFEGTIIRVRKALPTLLDIKIAAILITVASIGCYIGFAVTLFV